MTDLDTLYDFTDEQAGLVHQAYPFWPCKKDCDVLGGKNCCHQSFFPVSATEWTRVKEALLALPKPQRLVVKRAARRLYDAYQLKTYKGRFAPFFKEHGAAVEACPLLDGAACRCYGARPLVCHAFGYFQDEASGKWCTVVHDAVRTHGVKKAPSWAALVDRMTRTLRGPVRPLAAWVTEDFSP